MTDDHQPNSNGIDRRTFLQTAAVAGVGSAGLAGGVAADATVTRLPAEVTTVEKPTRVRSYPTLQADGTRTGERAWRTIRGTGNCCENYLAGAADGRLFDMGGNYLYATADDGRTWTRVAPSTPYPATSEGCVSAAPGGDVVAIDWNPYSGDRVIAYKYVASEAAWYYNEVPLSTPFYDRPWFAVFEGPFSVGGTTVPYVTVMKGGWPENDAALYVSLDGLTYELASSRVLDSAANGSVERYLDVPADGDLDWTQPHTMGRFTPLGGGTALSADSLGSTCDRTLLTGGPAHDVQWSCFDTPTGLPPGRLLADSRGHLHQVRFAADDRFVYRYSADGGRNWRRFDQQLPGNYELREEMLFDFKANGELATTAVAVHATDPAAEVDQDMVFRFTGVEPGADPDREILLVGKADESYVVGVSTEERFDFTTLALLPDGRVAVSFADGDYENPRVAVELPQG